MIPSQVQVPPFTTGYEAQFLDTDGFRAPSLNPPSRESPTPTAISWEQKNLLVHWKLIGFLIVNQTVLVRPCGSSTYLQVVQVPGRTTSTGQTYNAVLLALSTQIEACARRFCVPFVPSAARQPICTHSCNPIRCITHGASQQV